MTKKGKIIVIEGTDCSGKETQSRLLEEKLCKIGVSAKRISFPMYDTPTGKIIGACLLGKPQMCEELLKDNHSFFPEGGGNIDYLAACDYYAADRRYHLPLINQLLEENDILIIDRYVTSNMAHRGGQIKDKDERIKVYKKIELMEYEVNELPVPDATFLLYLPFEYGTRLRNSRSESLDEVERNEEYLKIGEKAYLELADLYDYNVINCVNDDDIRSIEDINEELFNKVKSLMEVQSD